jgi:hypothetical protein
MLTITSTRTRLMAAAAMVAVAPILANCGGGGDGGGTGPAPITKSSFSATLSGAISGTYSGESVYGQDTQGNFALGLGAGTGQNQGLTIVFVRGAAGKPGAQTYDLADLTAGEDPSTGKFWAMMTVASGASATSLAGKSGSLKITDTSGGRLKGTFSFTAVPLTGSGSTVSVTGQFDAVNGTVTIP